MLVSCYPRAGWLRWHRSELSIWNVLDCLTFSSWSLNKKSLTEWLESNQRGPLELVVRAHIRLYLGSFMFAFHTTRFLFYLLVFHRYEEMIVEGQIVKPRFPYYFGDITLLLTTFALYIYIGSFMASTYGLLTTTRFYPFGQMQRGAQHLRWNRAFLYIDAMVRIDPDQCQEHFYLLRMLPPLHYERYRRIFQLILHVHRWGIYCNNFNIFLFFAIVHIEIMRHPEWNYPVSICLATNLMFQIWYYYLFNLIFSSLIIFALNSLFVKMLLDSMMAKVTHKVALRQVLTLFEECTRILADLNGFWKAKYAHYCLLMMPCMMVCLYVLLFVQTNRVFYVVLLYVGIVFNLSLHLVNLLASSVRNTAMKLYRHLHHRRIVSRARLVCIKLKLTNMLDVIESKSHQYGIKIGSIATVDHKSTILIMVVTVRCFMFAVKMARGMH